MKNFVNAMNKYGKCSEYLRDNFPKLSDAKLKEAKLQKVTYFHPGAKQKV
jgi:hypothetical protein